MRIFLIVLFISSISFFGFVSTRIVRSSLFDSGVKSNLDFASYYAVIGDVEQAECYLNRALTWLEQNSIQDKYTSIFTPSAEDDVGVFYKNIQMEREVLHKATSASADERVHIIKGIYRTKLSLLDNKPSIVIERSRDLRQPVGISICPYNFHYFLWGLISFMLITGSFILLILSI